MQISYSELRQNLKQTIEMTADTHEAVVITSHKEPKAVLLSYEDYCALEETAYLLKTPANAKKLLTAIADIKKSKKLVERGLLDDEA